MINLKRKDQRCSCIQLNKLKINFPRGSNCYWLHIWKQKQKKTSEMRLEMVEKQKLTKMALMISSHCTLLCSAHFTVQTSRGALQDFYKPFSLNTSIHTSTNTTRLSVFFSCWAAQPVIMAVISSHWPAAIFMGNQHVQTHCKENATHT